MARPWDTAVFDAAYKQFICQKEFPFGTPEYYARYRSRYKALLERFAQLAPAGPVDVLDIGGGQLALLAQTIWNDRTTVSELPDHLHVDYFRKFGITLLPWNLCTSGAPVTSAYDFVFFSEVIEHLPMPGYVVLERLRTALRPGGTLICSTPNLYRLRNVVFMALGRQIFAYMQLPGNDSLEHVLEYSRDHLQWQFEKAGFRNATVELVQMHHSPNNPAFRVMSWIGYPLLLVPRFRDTLLAIGVN